MTEEMDAIDVALGTLEVETHAEWRKIATGAPVSTGQAYRQFTDTGRQMKQAAQGAALRIEQLRSDDTMFPEGRERLVQETSEAASRELAKLDDRQATTLTVMAKDLEAAAMPRLDKSREMAARDEARMILDGNHDPVGTMAQLATRGDEVAAVLVGPYGESYLRAQGFTPKDAAEGHSTVRVMALNASRTSQDPHVRAAATAYFGLDRLRGVRAVTRSLAWSPLEKAGVRR